MAHDRSGWRSAGRRIGKVFGRKPLARRRNNLVRRVESGIEQLEPRWVLTAGALDTTFDPVDLDGVLIGNLGVATANVRFTTVTTQADGKILAAGSFDALSNNRQDFVVARFNADGSLDTTFGVDGSDADSLPDGYITFDFSLPAGQSIAQDITLDSLGRIIVVGNGPSAANFNSWAIARLTTSGQLDSTFNGTGKVVTSWTGSSGNIGAEAHGVAIDSSDRIVVVGDVRNSSSSTEFDWGIVRYNTNGSMDTSFGSSGTGRVTVNFFGSRDVANDVKIQADGKIVVAGYARNGTQSDDFAIARFDANGLLDSSFGVAGLVNTNIDPTAFVSQDQASSLQIEADGRIVLTGFSNVRPGSVSTFTTTEFTVARYTATGALDTTFNPTPSASFPSVPGTRRIDFGGNKDLAEAVGIQVDGQYVIAGSVSNPTVNDDNDKFGLVRLVNNSLLVPDGTLDSAFGSGGQVTTRITDYVAGTISVALLTDMTLQPDGKIVTTGYVRGSDNRERFVIARYESGLATQTIAGDANVDEGATYTLNLSSGDPTTSQWTINWGDSTQVVSGNPTSVTHVYADGNANYIVTATVTTATGTSPITNSVAVAVNNVAPTLAISGAASVDEGAVYTLNLSSSDPGADTISQWTINWGDSIEVISGNPSSATHTYADGSAGYTISATATDEDGSYAAGNTVDISVQNVAPTLVISGALDVNEGATYTLNLASSDPGADTITSWTIHWGDSIEVVSGNPSSATHAYADGDANYTISATATDEDGTYLAGNTVDVTVHNVAPTLAISGATDVNEGDIYTLNLSSSDPGADSISSWTINWGDSIEVVSGNPASVTHTYTDGDASYSITATAADEDGSYAAALAVVVAVHNVAPTLAISGNSDVDEGSSYTLNLLASDPGDDTILQWTINWGDSIEVISGNPSSATHTYADGSASYTISATATDEDGTYTASNTVDVIVNNVAPTLAISGAASVNEGSVYTLDLSSSDPGADTISSWTLNWGDSTEVVVGNPSSVSHTYTDGSASYTISATATDEDGTYAASNTVDVDIHNVAPTLTISGAASVNEGSTYTLNLSSSDPGADTITSWTIHWGDSIEVVSGNPSSATHAYADGDANYTISATATDEDGTYLAGNTVDVTVHNVAPTLAISGAASVNEGSVYTLNLSSSDPGADTITQWTINWGNGTQVVSGNPSSVTHVYPNGPASYTITATAADEDGTYAAVNTVAITVNNVAPTINSLTITPAVDANQPATLTGTYSDPGTSDTHQVDIDWNGDGTFDQTVAVSGGSFSVNHAYASAGTLNVKARVRDNNGGTSAIATAQVTVLGVGATLVAGTLHIVGTDQSDIVTIDKSGNQLKVVASFVNNFSPVSFNLASVTQIYVRVYGGSDIVAVKNAVTIPAIIDGGAGSDVLTAGGGNTYLLGGAGNDVLVGGPGNNVLVGGAGSDVITGGSGRDLVIGGDGTDVLSGGTGDDIMISGWTIHDTNVAALNAVMDIWTSSASFNSRVATLTALGGLLEANVAVFDDDDHDVLSGASGRDLVFANTNLWSGDFDVVALQLIDDLLVSLT